MGKRIVLLLIIMLVLLGLSVSAADWQTTNTTVYIINTGPTANSVTVTSNPSEPGDSIYIKSNVTDVNGIPDDITNVTVVLDMGTPTNESDDVSLNMVYNTSSGLYENTSYTLPLNSPFGVYTANSTAIDDFDASDWVTGTFNVTDLTNPVINTVSDNSPVDPGSTLNITANVTDNVAVDDVFVEINATNYSMTQAGSTDIYYYDDYDTNVIAGTYDYTVYANDTYGNDATPVTDNFTVNALVALTLEQVPIEFGNTTIPVTSRHADNGTAGDGYTGGTIKGFPMVINNTGNVNENFSISGTDMTGQTQGSYEVGVGNLTYDTDGALPAAYNLSTSLTQFVGDVAWTATQDVYFWISIPEGIPSQNYVGTINVSAVQS